MNKEQLAKKCKKLIGSDTARISQPREKMFLIIGYWDNTANYSGEWVDSNNNKIPDWDYVNESVVASGYTAKEVIKSAKKYVKLCNMSWYDYFKEYHDLEIPQLKEIEYENVKSKNQ